MELHYASLFIGGDWVAPSTSATITAISASTEQPIGSVPEAQEADVDAAVAAARRAFDDPAGWAHWAPADRATAMERLVDVLERRAEDVVQRVSAQNGMPVAVARQLEGAFPVILLRYYAGLARDTATEETRPDCSAATPWFAVNRSAWSGRSCHGTSRRPSPRSSTPPRWPPGARW
jgi:aldehyde dehydrogenase (NAD+)